MERNTGKCLNETQLCLPVDAFIVSWQVIKNSARNKKKSRLSLFDKPTHLSALLKKTSIFVFLVH